jgi:hypothetical protein
VREIVRSAENRRLTSSKFTVLLIEKRHQQLHPRATATGGLLQQRWSPSTTEAERQFGEGVANSSSKSKGAMPAEAEREREKRKATRFIVSTMIVIFICIFVQRTLYYYEDIVIKFIVNLLRQKKKEPLRMIEIQRELGRNVYPWYPHTKEIRRSFSA